MARAMGGGAGRELRVGAALLGGRWFRGASWCRMGLMVSALAAGAKLCTTVVEGLGSSTSGPREPHPNMFVWLGQRHRAQP